MAAGCSILQDVDVDKFDHVVRFHLHSGGGDGRPIPGHLPHTEVRLNVEYFAGKPTLYGVLADCH